MWTKFMDMHSGGSTKEGDYQYIYIEAEEDQAKIIFFNRFGHNPERVSCTCCGEDYSISSEETFAQASAYERGCAWSNEQKAYIEQPSTRFAFHPFKSVEEYQQSPNVLVISAKDIKDEERVGEVPEQGYVWRD